MKKKVATKSQFPASNAMVAQIGEQLVAIFRVNGKFFATEELCPHRAGPLSEGLLKGDQIICPWHGARFEVTSGKCLSAIGKRDLNKFEVIEEDDDLLIEFPDKTGAKH